MSITSLDEEKHCHGLQRTGDIDGKLLIAASRPTRQPCESRPGWLFQVIVNSPQLSLAA
jgi:hypothetical protein